MNTMNKEYEVLLWNDVRSALRERYPTLTNADLNWRHSSIDDLLEMIALKLGKSGQELRDIVDEM